jgi:thiamine monophosphate synthase
VHTRDEVAALSAEDALDYLLFGTVFETASKPGQPATGVSDLANVVTAAGRMPMLAVGGVTLENAAHLAGSGCAGFAAIGLFADGPEVDLATTVTAALAAWENPR